MRRARRPISVDEARGIAMSATRETDRMLQEERRRDAAESTLPFGAGLEETDEERFWRVRNEALAFYLTAKVRSGKCLLLSEQPSNGSDLTAPPLTGWAAHPHADVLCGGEEDCR